MDNIFIERLWRSLKYQAVHLRELGGGFETRRVIGVWMAFYNAERPHSALGGRTPREAYAAGSPVDLMDKVCLLAHMPTGATATAVDRKGFGGMISNRCTP